MTALGALIRNGRKAKGLTQEQLAAALGVSPGAIAQWERGLTAPTTARLAELVRLLGVNAGDLLAAADPPPAALPPPPVAPAPGPQTMNLVALELLPGRGDDAFAVDLSTLRQVHRPPKLAGRKDVMAALVVGTSMRPWIEPGGMIVVEQARKPRLGDHVLVRLAEGNAWILRRLIRETASEVMVRQYSPDRKTTLARQDIAAIMRVMELADLLD